jgi:hypothetical protein
LETHFIAQVKQDRQNQEQKIGQLQREIVQMKQGKQTLEVWATNLGQLIAESHRKAQSITLEAEQQLQQQQQGLITPQPKGNGQQRK